MRKKKKSEKGAEAQETARPVGIEPMPKPVSTNEHPGPTYIGGPVRRAVPGPRTDGAGGTTTGPNVEPNADGRFILQHATADELRAFRAQLEARLNMKDVPSITMPDGSRISGQSVLTGCVGCGRWEWAEPRHVNTPCIFCNPRRQAGNPGIIRLASEKERAEWFKRETAKVKAQADGVEARRKEREEFHKRQAQDGKA